MWSISFLSHSLPHNTMEEVKLAFSLCFYEKWIPLTINSVQLNELRCSFGWIKMTWNIVQFLGMVWRNLIFLFAAREREGNEYKLPPLNFTCSLPFKYIAFLIHTAVRSVMLKNYRAKTTSYFTIFPSLHEGFRGSIQAIKNIPFREYYNWSTINFKRKVKWVLS